MSDRDATPRQAWTPASIRVIQPPPTLPALPRHCVHPTPAGGLQCCECPTTWPSMHAWASAPGFECRGPVVAEAESPAAAERCEATGYEAPDDTANKLGGRSRP